MTMLAEIDKSTVTSEPVGGLAAPSGSTFADALARVFKRERP
jgi:hypothetical protein